MSVKNSLTKNTKIVLNTDYQHFCFVLFMHEIIWAQNRPNSCKRKHEPRLVKFTALAFLGETQIVFFFLVFFLGMFMQSSIPQFSYKMHKISVSTTQNTLGLPNFDLV